MPCYRETYLILALQMKNRGMKETPENRQKAAAVAWSVMGDFDYSKIQPNPSYERLSSVAPYPPRKWASRPEPAPLVSIPLPEPKKDLPRPAAPEKE